MIYNIKISLLLFIIVVPSISLFGQITATDNPDKLINVILGPNQIWSQWFCRISIDKTDPMNIILCNNLNYGGFNYIHYSLSNNYGNDWSQSLNFTSPLNPNGNPSESNRISPYNPSIAFDASERVYISNILPLTPPDNIGSLPTLEVNYSDNYGINWSRAFIGLPNSPDNYYSYNYWIAEQMTCTDEMQTSPFKNNIYSIFEGINENIYLYVSSSGNKNFPFKDPPKEFGIGDAPTVQTGPNGEVYICYYIDDDNNNSKNVKFEYSTDGGLTFIPSTAFTLNSNFESLPNLDYPSMAVDKSCNHRNRIYIAYTDYENEISNRLVIKGGFYKFILLFYF